jgi:hypothetical protein
MAVYPQPAASPAAPRALGLGELLDRTVQIYRRHFTFFAVCAIVVALPDIIFTILGAKGISGVVRFFYAPFTLALLYLGASQIVFQGQAQLGPVMNAAFHRYGNFAGVYAGYILAALAFIIPPLGLWLIVRWAFAASVLASEPVKPRQALRRSAELVQGQWWRCFFTLAMVLILEIVIVMVLAFSAGLVIGLIPGLGSRATRVLLATVFGTVLASLAVPLVSIGYTLIYVDLRVRKEGLDLDRLATSAADAA